MSLLQQLALSVVCLCGLEEHRKQKHFRWNVTSEVFWR
jgi:hypothetical protein